MKKIMTLLGIMMFISGISYGLTDTNTSDIDILKGQGYSETALRAIDTARMHQQYSGDNKYQKQYVEKNSKNKFGKMYTTLKTYVDPIQEDNLFGERQVNFSNTWQGDETHYSQRSELMNNGSNQVVEDL